jgi:hypothetical protein
MTLSSSAAKRLLECNAGADRDPPGPTVVSATQARRQASTASSYADRAMDSASSSCQLRIQRCVRSNMSRV